MGQFLLSCCKKYYVVVLLIAVVAIFILILSRLLGGQSTNTSGSVPELLDQVIVDKHFSKPSLPAAPPEEEAAQAPVIPLPVFSYHEVDTQKIQAWLDEKNSMLAEGAYLATIYDAAKEKDVDVLLLIAILGQEQGFVPRDHDKAHLMINNPFNVYGSWQRYNTDLHDSATIAANTIVRLRSDLPEGENSFLWLNTHNNDGSGYAEDVNWWKGVHYFYKELFGLLNKPLPEEHNFTSE